MQPRCVEAHGPPLSAKVLLVSIDPVDWNLPGDNERVSNSAFKVTRIIEWYLDLVYLEGGEFVLANWTSDE